MYVFLYRMMSSDFSCSIELPLRLVKFLSPSAGVLAALDDAKRVIFANRHLCTTLNAEGQAWGGGGHNRLKNDGCTINDQEHHYPLQTTNQILTTINHYYSPAILEVCTVEKWWIRILGGGLDGFLSWDDVS